MAFFPNMMKGHFHISITFTYMESSVSMGSDLFIYQSLVENVVSRLNLYWTHTDIFLSLFSKQYVTATIKSIYVVLDILNSL